MSTRTQRAPYASCRKPAGPHPPQHRGEGAVGAAGGRRRTRPSSTTFDQWSNTIWPSERGEIGARLSETARTCTARRTPHASRVSPRPRPPSPPLHAYALRPSGPSAARPARPRRTARHERTRPDPSHLALPRASRLSWGPSRPPLHAYALRRPSGPRPIRPPDTATYTPTPGSESPRFRPP